MDPRFAGKIFDLAVYLILLGLIVVLFHKKKVLRASFFLFTAALLFEVLFIALLRDPSFRACILKKPSMFIGRVYAQQQRKVMYDPACSQYDEGLGYTLKPGDCAFNNAEFSTNLHINDHGLRDDEESLKAPAVIAAGDSFTMGWGVQQDETFPQIVEKESGLKTLNAGIASYGTVREMSLLSRLDLSGLKYLIIQYCLNDDEENQAYNEHGNRLVPMSRAEYEDQLRAQRVMTRYFPGKHAADLLFVAYNELRKAAVGFLAGSQKPGSAKYFLNAFKHAAPWEKMDTRDLRVMVLAVGGGPGFCGEVLNGMRGPEGYPVPADHMACENVAFIGQTPPLHYPLDFHWNAAGHRQVALQVLNWIKTSRQTTSSRSG